MTTKGRAEVFGGVGAGIGLLVLVLYVILIVNEGDDTLREVAPWAVIMGAATAAAAIGAATARHRLLFLAGVVFIVIGIPSIFSVGLPLIVAGLLCLLASSHSIHGPEPP